jgi:transposase InsO family protein
MARSITSEHVLDVVARLIGERGAPGHIRSDNGSEFIAKQLRTWLGELGVETLYIAPGGPWQNGYAESFNSRLREGPAPIK